MRRRAGSGSMLGVTTAEPLLPQTPEVVGEVVAPEEDGVWAPQRRRMTLGLCLTITLVAFEALAISTVMPVVADDLGQLGLYGWVFSGFFLGNLIGIVWAGQVADRRGTWLPFAAGLVLVSAGLLVGGLAGSMAVLVAARVAQGIGAGVIPAVAYTTVGRSYPPALRPRVFAVFSSAWVVPGNHRAGRRVGAGGCAGVEISVSRPAPLRGDRRRHDPSVARAHGSSSDWRSTHGPARVRAGARRRRDPGADRRGGQEVPVAVGLVALGVPLAVAAFLRLVPAGTVRLAPGMPAAVMARGILTFAFFGTDAFVSLVVLRRPRAGHLGGRLGPHWRHALLGGRCVDPAAPHPHARTPVAGAGRFRVGRGRHRGDARCPRTAAGLGRGARLVDSGPGDGTGVRAARGHSPGRCATWPGRRRQRLPPADRRARGIPGHGSDGGVRGALGRARLGARIRPAPRLPRSPSP